MSYCGSIPISSVYFSHASSVVSTPFLDLNAALGCQFMLNETSSPVFLFMVILPVSFATGTPFFVRVSENEAEVL